MMTLGNASIERAPESSPRTPSSYIRELGHAATAPEKLTSVPTSTADANVTSPVGLDAAAAILGANAFSGLDTEHVLGALARLVRGAAARPRSAVRISVQAAREAASILRGRSTIAPARGDRRFAHAAFAESPVYRRLLQLYLAACRGAHHLVDEADLDWKSRERARLALSLATEALAPTNTLLGNPAAVERAWRTRGKSLLKGTRNLWTDVRTNGAMPRQVDTSGFTLGRNVAASPGAVVFRNDVLEVVQYACASKRVHERPVVVIPPQINKFYVIDLAPGRSFIEHAAKSGLQPFVISWRNPTAAERDWDLDTYVAACKEALEAVCAITGTQDVNVVGACAGGLTTAVLLGHLAATGSMLVHSVTFLVTVLDTESQHAVAPFVTEKTVAAAVHRSRRHGVLDGREMARMFAWLRPNDLVWSYWVNNYLLGREPPAFDILFWNADTTRLPAALHAQFLSMMLDNPLTRSGGLEVLGTPIDLKQVTADAYVVAGGTDHITPWRACFRTPHLLGGRTELVLSTSGHIQSVVNPPGGRRASFHVGGDAHLEPDVWLDGSTKIDGSWWAHWVAWIRDRSGAARHPPARLGSWAYPTLDPAPGLYVREQ